VEVPAIVTAGDLHAAKTIHGESKAYLPIEGRPLVAHVVSVLQRVPEVKEVWVVGNSERLSVALGDPALRAELRKPLHVVPQHRNLYENAWQTYRRLLPGAGPAGRDPGPADADLPVLYLSTDLPFATPQEISEFVRRAGGLSCDYALGLVTEEAMRPFYPKGPEQPGIRMAYFNLREGRFRQSNLHLVRPARIVNRHYIAEMYEHRYQKELGNIVALAWRILRSESGGLRILWYYLLIHLASVADRRGLRRTADRIRRGVPIAKVEACCASLLRASFRFVVTDLGGCAVDVDNDRDFDVAKLRYREWMREQRERAERLYGPLPLPAAGEEKRA